MSDYTILSKTEGPGCKSHEAIEPAHLFGNTNWTMRTVDHLTYSFTCGQCGQVILVRRNTDRVLL